MHPWDDVKVPKQARTLQQGWMELNDGHQRKGGNTVSKPNDRESSWEERNGLGNGCIKYSQNQENKLSFPGHQVQEALASKMHKTSHKGRSSCVIR